MICVLGKKFTPSRKARIFMYFPRDTELIRPALINVAISGILVEIATWGEAFFGAGELSRREDEATHLPEHCEWSQVCW